LLVNLFIFRWESARHKPLTPCCIPKLQISQHKHYSFLTISDKLIK
jgi:hypothetical protein